MVRNLKKRVLILGGYGSLGSAIARLLADRDDLQLIIAGHRRGPAEQLAATLPGPAEALRLERDAINLSAQLQALHLDLLIHCAGPFDNPFDDQNYRVACACIEARTPYLDTADGRRFVCDFPRLSPAARTAGIPLVAGASTLPGLSSAVLAELQGEFSHIDSVDITLTPSKGLDSGLGCVNPDTIGTSFPALRDGQWRESHAGTGLRRIRLAHPVGERWACNADAADLELWPRALPGLRHARVGAGGQPQLLQRGLGLVTGLTRRHLPGVPRWLARQALRLAPAPGQNPGHGGVAIHIGGIDRNQAPLGYRWQVLGLDGDDAWIPAAPAAAMARKMLDGHYCTAGASACWQLLDLRDILIELNRFSVISACERLDASCGQPILPQFHPAIALPG